MSTQKIFTIEQFYAFLREKKLMAGKCNNCGKIHLPPRPLCDRCFSKEFKWLELPCIGKLLTYTVIYYAPPQFPAPYAVGILQLEKDLRIPGIIKEKPIDTKKLDRRPKLRIEFECSDTQKWPKWPRYCFKYL